MSNTRIARLIVAACTASGALAACGPERVPNLVPPVEPLGEPNGRHPDLPSQYELELCFRRVPIPRC